MHDALRKVVLQDSGINFRELQFHIQELYTEILNMYIKENRVVTG
jgi:hypothetical protein